MPPERSPSPRASPDHLTLVLGDREPFELLYVAEREGFLLLPSEGLTGWATEALRREEVSALLPDGRELRLHASLVSSTTDAEAAMRAFRSKYGEERWARHFEHASRVLRLDPRGSGREPPAPLTPIDLARDEFDAIAPRYTATNLSDPLEMRLKRRSIERMLGLFEGRDPLLEIGAGTGLETLPLLEAGHRVVAVDLSSNMLAELRGRAEAQGVGALLETRTGRLGRLPQALGDLPEGHFQGGVSTFGAMNLEPELATVPRDLHRLLAPGAPLFLAVLNPWGIAPVLYVTGTGRPREALARWGQVVPAGAIRYPLEVRMWSPASIRRAFLPYFGVVRFEAASVIAPPWSSRRLLDLFSHRALRSFDRFDRALGRRWPWNQLGEWLFVTLRREG